MKFKSLIAKMTLEEKASLCSGLDYWHTKPIPRLHIPAAVLSDGPHGLRRLVTKGLQGGSGRTLPATCFPTAATLANSWDEELLTKVGEALGEEAAARKVSVLLGPGCNIKRNPLCGRNFEYFSEDPFLSGKAAVAMIRGIQSRGVSACIKHFAVNSQELNRLTNNSVVDERTLRELYFPAFEMAIKEGGVCCLMSSYNLVNGIYATENPHLLQDVLRDDWGYDGVIVSDWGAVDDRVAALKAGCHLEMPGCSRQADCEIVEAVKDGTLDEGLLDERIDTLLSLIHDTRRPPKPDKNAEKAHRALAAQAAAKCAVLLKNENDLLPLKKDTRVAVIGCFAASPRYQGEGSSKVVPTELISPLRGLHKAGVNIIGYAPGFRRSGHRDIRMAQKACALAKTADTVLLFLGLSEQDEAEGKDRTHMRLDANQISLLEKLKKVNPHIAVILSAGSIVEMNWDEHAQAVLLSGLGGQAGGIAIAQVLTGAYNPSGKLSETVPLRYEDVPSARYYPGREATSEYREAMFVGYRYYDTAGVAVKYPFGFGLSYTQFAYTDLHVENDTVSFTVKNTGKVAGTEIAQVYLAPHAHGVFRPKRTLCGFARVELAPDEEKAVSVSLPARSFAVWNTAENRWVVEPGDYEIQVGSSCADIRLTQVVTKTGDTFENPYTEEELAPYFSAQVQNIPDESFAALLQNDIPPRFWDPEAGYGMNDSIAHSANGKGFGKFLYRVADAAHWGLEKLGRRRAARRIEEVTTLPYRGYYRMSNMLSKEQVEALLKAVNREKGGLRAFARSLLHKKQDR